MIGGRRWSIIKPDVPSSAGRRRGSMGRFFEGEVLAASARQTGGAFSVTFTRAGRAVTVAVSGDVDGDTAPVLRDRLVDVLEGQGNRSVSVDLSGMTFIDSSGLSVLVDMHRRAAERGA
ncbi:MAG TPA: STAS domain-containing protein, partial [Acidimicrobiales bacterium]|nr:STAS domain-containing protein [Acidimicrobiales bacterium]